MSGRRRVPIDNINDLMQRRQKATQQHRNKESTSELEELEDLMSTYQYREPELHEEFAPLNEELQDANENARQWKDALEMDINRHEISSLEESTYDYRETMNERDEAIEDLVRQSLLLKEEHQEQIKRLQRENKSFAKEILEQNSKLTRFTHGLQVREEQIGNLQKEVFELKRAQRQSCESFMELQIQATELEADLLLERRRSPESNELHEQIEKLKAELIRERRKTSEATTALKEEASTLKTEHSRLRAASFVTEAESPEHKKLLERFQHGRNSNGSDGHRNELEAELEELRDRNEIQRIELQELRRELWAATEAAGRANDLQRELTQARHALEGSQASPVLQKQVKEAEATNRILKERIEQLEKMRRIEADTVNNIEAKPKSVTTNSGNDQDIEKLEAELFNREMALQKADLLAQKLTRNLNTLKGAYVRLEQEASGTMLNAPKIEEIEEFQRMNDSLFNENHELRKANKQASEDREEMQKELKNLRTQLDFLENEKKTIGRLKNELEEAKEKRVSAETSIVSSYERQLTAMGLDKTTTVEKLEKDLEDLRWESSRKIGEMTGQLEAHQDENERNRKQFMVQLEAKNQAIFALEKTLHAQEQVIDSMKEEMDHLQQGMVDSTKRRRDESENLQQEIMELETNKAKLEREMLGLKTQLDASKNEKEEEVARLNKVISSLKEDNQLAKDVANSEDINRIMEVRQRLGQLKDRNTSLAEENERLVSRLDRALKKNQSLSTYKDQARTFEQECSALRNQVEELEQSIVSFKNRPQASKAAAVEAEVPSKKNPKGMRGMFTRRSKSRENAKTRTTVALVNVTNERLASTKDYSDELLGNR